MTHEEVIKEANRLGPVFTLQVRRVFTWKPKLVRSHVTDCERGYDVLLTGWAWLWFIAFANFARYYQPPIQTGSSNVTVAWVQKTWSADQC